MSYAKYNRYGRHGANAWLKWHKRSHQRTKQLVVRQESPLVFRIHVMYGDKERVYVVHGEQTGVDLNDLQRSTESLPNVSDQEKSPAPAQTKEQPNLFPRLTLLATHNGRSKAFHDLNQRKPSQHATDVQIHQYAERMWYKNNYFLQVDIRDEVVGIGQTEAEAFYCYVSVLTQSYRKMLEQHGFQQQDHNARTIIGFAHVDKLWDHHHLDSPLSDHECTCQAALRVADSLNLNLRDHRLQFDRYTRIYISHYKNYDPDQPEDEGEEDEGPNTVPHQFPSES